MNILTFRGRGAHRALTGSEKDDLIRQQAEQITQLSDENHELLCAVGRAAVTAAKLDAANKRIIRDAADIARLRQAVINARPRIAVVDSPLDRPYVAGVPIPYPVPVGRSKANDETQELALLDQPTVELSAAS